MSWLEKTQVNNIELKIYDGGQDGTEEAQQIKKLFNLNRNPMHKKSVQIELVDEHVQKGWTVEKETHKGKRASLIMEKPSSVRFENEVWCMFYNLGIRYLNHDNKLELPFGKNPNEKKQIDVFAVDTENKIVFLVECKASQKKTKKSFKTEIESMAAMKDGFTKSIYQIFDDTYKVQLIFATRNYRITTEDEDSKRLKNAGIYHLVDSKFSYIKNIITNYNTTAKFQFLGLIFKGTKISDEKLCIPALRGKMGGLEYYMFSLEPNYLLKIGYVLHRVRANEEEDPTYQRMLVKSRLKKIGEFLNEPEHFFPNSVIINFKESKTVKIIFEPGHPSRDSTSKSQYGMLKIPMAFAIANIIDGQHRIYGYSQSVFFEKDTIPVVAFVNMTTERQLEMFIDVNQNQKPISPDLIDTLQENLNWDSEFVDSRMKALKSSIIRTLAEEQGFVLNGLITQGGDTAQLKRIPFRDSLENCGLIPKAKKKAFKLETAHSCLYDVSIQDMKVGLEEMERARKKVASFINSCYEVFATKYPNLYNKASKENFIISNKGTYAFIMIIGSLNDFLTINKHEVFLKSSNKERVSKIEKYLIVLFDELENIDNDIEKKLFNQEGAKARPLWFHTFQDLISKRIPEYLPPELIDWRERQDVEIQEEGKQLMTNIESYMKDTILSNLKVLYGEEIVHKASGLTTWEMKIGHQRTTCLTRMDQAIQAEYDSGSDPKEYDWTDFFMITEYSSILDANWTAAPSDDTIGYKTFQDIFTVDLGGHKGDVKIKEAGSNKYTVIGKGATKHEWEEGKAFGNYPEESIWSENSRARKWDRSWINKIIPLRNLIAHEGSKQKSVSINNSERELLRFIYASIKQSD
jgi:DNA sulfur modification protein DndB